MWEFVKTHRTKFVYSGTIFLVLMSSYGYYWYLEKSKVDTNEPAIVANKSSYNIGDLVELKVKHRLVNVEKVSVDWKILDGYNEKSDFKRGCDESSIQFGTGNTDKTLLVLASVSYVGKDFHKVYIVTTLVKIGAGPIPPPPGPPIPPTPPSPPSFPNEKHGLSTFTYNEFATLNISKKVEFAKGLAGVFDSYAASIAAGTAKDAETVLQDVTKANNTVMTNLGLSRDVVLPFFTKLQTKLTALDNNIGLGNLTNLRQCFVEISDGLKAIK